MYEELVKRIKDKAERFDYDGWVDTAVVMEKAADAIEELTKDLERSKEWESFWQKEANKALRKLQVAASRTAEGGSMTCKDCKYRYAGKGWFCWSGNKVTLGKCNNGKPSKGRIIYRKGEAKQEE